MSDAAPASRPPLLVFLVDALRHDYVTPDATPFLSGLAADGTQRDLHTILGYSDAVRATIFTGRYPDESNYWMEYCFRPGSTLFGRLGRLGALDALPTDFGLRVLKYGLSATVLKRRARSLPYRSLELRHFPFRSLHLFDHTLDRPMTDPSTLEVPTVFEHLDASGRRSVYLSSTTAHRGDPTEDAAAVDLDTALVFVYFHQIDMASHVFGLDSPRFQRTVADVDRKLERLTNAVRRRLGDAEVVVISDHGMSRIERDVDMRALVRHPDFGTRFCAALDSTMVRLWFLDADDKLRDEVRAIVSERLPGRFLSDDDLTAFHIRFHHRLYGDEIYLVDQGTAIFPNFHSYVRPKAMHTYDPNGREQDGAFVAHPAIPALADRSSLEMVEVAPLLCDLVGVPPLGAQPRS